MTNNAEGFLHSSDLSLSSGEESGRSVDSRHGRDNSDWPGADEVFGETVCTLQQLSHSPHR